MTKDNDQKKKPGRPSRQDIIAKKRQQRNGVSDMRNSMAIDKSVMEDGYVYRFVNDVPGRIKSYMARGWDLVSDKEKVAKTGEGSTSSNTNMGTAISLHAGVDGSKRAYSAFLMRLEQELYDEGEAAKAAELSKIDEALTRQVGTFGVQNATDNSSAKLTTTIDSGGGYKP